MDFNKLNQELYQQSANNRFSKNPGEYTKGYVKISNWLAELCFYYEQRRVNQEKYDEEEFKALIEEHRAKISELDDSEFKEGLLKALSEV